MTGLRAIAFTLTSWDTGRRLGAGLVSTESRYASVLLISANHVPTRGFLSPAQWKAVEPEIAAGLTSGPLPALSAIATALMDGRSSVVVRYLRDETADIGRPDR